MFKIIFTDSYEARAKKFLKKHPNLKNFFKSELGLGIVVGAKRVFFACKKYRPQGERSGSHEKPDGIGWSETKAMPEAP